MSKEIILDFIEKYVERSSYLKTTLEYIKYRLEQDLCSKSAAAYGFLELIQSIGNVSDKNQIKLQEEIIYKKICYWADSRAEKAITDKMYALSWLEQQIESIRNQDDTDSMGRTIRSRRDAHISSNETVVKETKRILEHNKDIETPNDLELGIKIDNYDPSLYLRRAIFYIKNGWDAKWTIDLNKKEDTASIIGFISQDSEENGFNRELFFSTFKEASEWAKKNPGKTITRCSKKNGYVVKKTHLKGFDT